MHESAPAAVPVPLGAARHWLVPAAALVVALLYWLTCARCVVGSGDSGDFIAAAACNGIPHPSGYPLYTTLAHPLLLLTAGSSPAFVLNLFAAACALGTVLLLMLITQRLTGSAVAAGLSGVWFAVGIPFWSQAVRAEVYTLHTLLLALVLGGMLGMVRSPRARWTYLAVSGLALALTNHLTAVTYVPALLVALWQRRSAWRVILAAALAGALLLAVLYGGIMLRAQAQPAVNWGDPSTPARLGQLVTLQLYSGLKTGNLDPGVKFAALWESARAQFGLSGLLLLCAGTAAYWRTQRAAAIILLLALLVPLATVLLLFSQRDTVTLAHAIGNHFLTAYVAAGVLLGGGVAWALDSGRVWRRLALVALLLLITVHGWRGYRACDLSQYEDVALYAYNILRQAPVDAIVLTHTDMTEFPLRYFQVAEQVRPDVTVLNDRLLGYDWYYPRAGLQVPAGATPQAKRQAAVAELLTRAAGNVYLCEALPEEYFAGYELQPHGLLFRVAARGDSMPSVAQQLRRYRDIIPPLGPAPAGELEPPIVRGNIALALRR